MRFAAATIGLLALCPLTAQADGPSEAPLQPVVADVFESTPIAGSGNVLRFTAGAGISASSSFFGSDDFDVSPSATFRFEYLRFGGKEYGQADPNAVDTGLRFGGSVRYVRERDSDDYPALTGLEDVDFSLEVGAGVTYAQPNYELFADVRYGVVGHESWVGELGADVFMRPNERLTLSVGPRVFIGSEDFADTYFSVPTGTTSPLAPFDAGGGVLSAGLEVGAEYQVNDTWGVEGAVRWDRFLGDAADSPIVLDGSDNNVSATILATRRFTLEF